VEKDMHVQESQSAGRAEAELITRQVREVIAAQGIKVYCPPIDEEDDNAAEHARQTQAVMPFSIIGSTNDVVTADGRTVKGREYLWGTAEGAYYPSDWCKRASASHQR